MILSVIVDDESAAIKVLENYVKRLSFVENVASFSNPVEALTFVNENQIDVVFLDINMPHLTGFSFMDMLKNDTKIVLTTAYSEYAIDGYKYDVVDYLTKPIPFDDFLRAVQRVQNRFLAASTANKLESLSDYIMVKTEHKGKYVKVKFENILYIESLKNYVAIYTLQKEQIITLLTMKELAEKLPKEHFIRTHKSFIVSLNHLKYVDGGEIVLQTDIDKIPLGITYRDTFFDLLESKMLQ
ncbi:LytR/AlgR family response regulator transcription factor [Arcticibacterium luteifluviistationis]|uniref:DNA-binding response regulator n=1 Tax=Arcticibacterium luteifluviistationis TaxID=1784714 RepID=A0A2Z4GEC0_9BACT|nr:LytTR family DNA-binding domain-containing protein [Arcticibacterium luteifluviistationis]AWV99520.1 DNA-binding response regulator [Arcticibacterium luteifluviistationis]